MLRVISSLLVLLLGATASPARGARPRTSLRPRWRQPHGNDGTGDGALEVLERPRARARRTPWRWPGVVELVRDTHTVQVPGTWTFEETPFHHRTSRSALPEAAPLPDLSNDSTGWATRMRTVLSLQEAGTRLRVGTVGANGWQTLEVAVPTRPPTIVQVDREAVATLLNGAVTVRLRIHG